MRLGHVAHIGVVWACLRPNCQPVEERYLARQVFPGGDGLSVHTARMRERLFPLQVLGNATFDPQAKANPA